MSGFTASNGITVFVRDGATVQFQHPTREASSGIVQIFPGSEWWQTLREFFRAEEDERLGRWRWPENPDYVVYREGDLICVTNERSGHGNVLGRRWYEEHKIGLLAKEEPGVYAAAGAYFDAHPEPKPWHDAKPGEIWALGIGGGYHGDSIAVVEVDGAPRFVWHVGGENGIRNIAINDRVIDYGRRVWPEDAS